MPLFVGLGGLEIAGAEGGVGMMVVAREEKVKRRTRRWSCILEKGTCGGSGMENSERIDVKGAVFMCVKRTLKLAFSFESTLHHAREGSWNIPLCLCYGSSRM